MYAPLGGGGWEGVHTLAASAAATRRSRRRAAAAPPAAAAGARRAVPVAALAAADGAHAVAGGASTATRSGFAPNGLYYEVWGDDRRAAKKLLVIPGLSARADSAWALHLVEHLASLRDASGAPLVAVASYDSQGAGRSYMPASFRAGFSTRAGAADAAALADHLGWPHFHVYSWSSGALVALRLAAAHPERVDSLTLLGAARAGATMLWSQTLGSPRGFCRLLAGLFSRRANAAAALGRFFSREWLDGAAPPGAARAGGAGGGAAATRRAVLLANALDGRHENATMDAHQRARGRLGQEWGAIRHRLSRRELDTLRREVVGRGKPLVLVTGARDRTAPVGAALRLAAASGGVLVAPGVGAHAGLAVERCADVLWALEGALFGGAAASTAEQRAECARRGEARILGSSLAAAAW